jgi:hypothetical protein
MRLMLVLLAAAAVYLSIYTMKKHGLEPGSQDFWMALVPACASGAIVVLAPNLKKKAKS